MRNAYQPELGDFVHLDFTPQSGTEQAGTEQAGRRPALVLSARDFNIATGLFFVCPVTNQVKGSSFEVTVPKGARLTGVILSDQLKSLDWISRNAAFHSKAPQETIDQVVARIQAIMLI